MDELQRISKTELALMVCRFVVFGAFSYVSLKFMMDTLDPTKKQKKEAQKKAQSLFDRLNIDVEAKLNEYELVVASQLIDPASIDISWNNIGGLDDIIEGIRNDVILPMRVSQLFKRHKPPTGVLLQGPPGCGKTMLAKATAREAGARFINLDFSMITNKWLGESEKLTKAVFTLAKKLQPCIIFIDEIDMFLRSRCQTDHEATAKMKAQFMALWDGIETDSDCQVVIMGASNRPHDIDDAIRRRMPARYTVGRPDTIKRREILAAMIEDGALDSNVDLNLIAQLTDGFSGSDLREVYRAADMIRIKEYAQLHPELLSTDYQRHMHSYQSDINRLRRITLSDFITVISKMIDSHLNIPQSSSSTNTTPPSNMAQIVQSAPYPKIEDQKPGTSGLRKPVRVFSQPNYVENFVVSLLEAAGSPTCLVVGGDGRYYSHEAIKKIVNICAANGVQRLLIGQNGILSTPAASALIRSLKVDGGILLTASHNPGGPDGDFGIKYNVSNGGPALEAFTNAAYEISKNLTSYSKLANDFNLDLTRPGSFKVHETSVEVVDSVENYLQLMKQCFDFDLLRGLLRDQKFSLVVDAMNGVMGPYAKRIFIDELEANSATMLNCTPSADFGGNHPDPNLVYAKQLVEHLEANKQVQMGVAFDGDGDRNMILGEGAFFISPGDSLAVIADHINELMQFEKSPVKGFARSFPTAPAVDRVAMAKELPIYETPTGWKFFGNLLDSGKISLCGEESFGTGSDHMREKDGMWAALAWLTLVAKNKMSIRELMEAHWKKYGRDFFCRYDYESLNSEQAMKMISELDQNVRKDSYLKEHAGIKVLKAGSFEYQDPVDGSVTKNQGYYFMLDNQARIVVRLSGTAGAGATCRIYINYHSRDYDGDSSASIAKIVEFALKVIRLTEHTGRRDPDVVT